jgi:hypothetical protein
MLWNPSSRYTVGALRPAILSEAEEAPHRRAEPSDSAAVIVAPSPAVPPARIPPRY